MKKRLRHYVALSISGFLFKISKNGSDTIWRYPFPDFCSKSRKTAVALYGAIHVRIFAQKLEKRPWHYVALSISGFLLKISKNGRGTMWRYPFPDFCSKSRKTAVALRGAIHFRIFAQNLEKWPWHYVALSISGFLLKISKNGRGTMWRYPFLDNFCSKSRKTAVALCGTMWRYPFPDFCSKSRKTAVALCGAIHFRIFGQKLEQRPWHYVALCGAIHFRIFGQNLEKRPWHYVALSISGFLFKISKNGRGTMWRYPCPDFARKIPENLGKRWKTAVAFLHCGSMRRFDLWEILKETDVALCGNAMICFLISCFGSGDAAVALCGPVIFGSLQQSSRKGRGACTIV